MCVRKRKRVMIQQEALGKEPECLLMVVVRDVVNHLVIVRGKGEPGEKFHF